MNQSSWRVGVVGAILLTILGTPAAAVAGGTGSDPANTKAALDAAGNWDVPPGWNPATAPRMSPKAPSKAAVALVNGSSLHSRGANSASPGLAASAPTGDSVNANQVAQNTSYYCGPAAVREALGNDGVASTQDGLASSLGTTTAGTDWYNGSGYPVANVLSNRDPRFSWVAVNVNYTPTAGQISTFKQNLVSDVTSAREALVGNAYEVSGGPHLIGHPVNRTIYHYFEIRGYSNSGGNTMYEDSVHAASSISWSGPVPAYSTMASSTIATIVGGRGYVW